MSSGNVMNATTKGAASASVRPMARFCERCAPSRIAGSDATTHFRQQDSAGSNADDAEGKLIDAIRVIERRHRAGGQERRNDGVGEQRELHARRTDDRRTERLEEAPHGSIETRLFQMTGTAFRRLAAIHTSSNSRTPAKATPQAAA